MNVLPEVINGVLLVLAVFVVNWVIRDRFREHEKREDERFAAVHQRLDRVETGIDRVEDRVERLRSDMTQLALALGTHTHSEAG